MGEGLFSLPVWIPTAETRRTQRGQMQVNELTDAIIGAAEE
jgi:hypothetical protein